MTDAGETSYDVVVLGGGRAGEILAGRTAAGGLSTVIPVGWTAAQAARRGLRVRSVQTEIGSTAGGQIQAEGYSGRGAIVVDEDAQVIVGATLVGQDVADLIHWATLAVVERTPLARLQHSVPSFPTMSEVWLHLLEEYGQ